MIGKYDAKMDDKNRLFVPAKLRGELGDRFYVTWGINCGHRCLSVFTAESWETLQRNYDALPLSSRSGATSLIFINAAECVPDKQYRILLPEHLQVYAGITRDIKFVGKAGQAEIWDSGEFAAFEQENADPAKLLASLEAIGL